MPSCQNSWRSRAHPFIPGAIYLHLFHLPISPHNTINTPTATNKERMHISSLLQPSRADQMVATGAERKNKEQSIMELQFKFDPLPSESTKNYEELEEWMLIYKYLVAGVPVPPDVLLPIRRDFEFLASRFYHHHASTRKEKTTPPTIEPDNQIIGGSTLEEGDQAKHSVAGQASPKLVRDSLLQLAQSYIYPARQLVSYGQENISHRSSRSYPGDYAHN
ncbi:hypothetical protein ZWY2020_020078 [Hordeum vulgare]|nr:hypothetical protein ZWY2020_020078 [Hordeum vulgare]